MGLTDVKEISEEFLKDGWNKDISFEELSLKEAKEKGYLFALKKIARGDKYFKMNVSGNIYNNKGKIVLYGRLLH